MPRASKVAAQLDPASGRDEMNLAEFPIALLSSREPEDGDPLVFETRHGRLTISGTEGPREDGNGLPTALDTDVLIGLLQLTKRANDFTEPTVYFSRYELLRIIRWADGTRSYRRLRASLKRWAKVSLDYEKSWFDNRRQCRVDKTVHILNEVTIYERPGRDGHDDPGQGEPPASSVSWGRTFFQSCQANYLKRLDLDVYFSLGSAATKQLYRFLDKHFYDHEALTYDLRELAVGHVGLSANYTIPRIKEKLAPCLEELERIDFIQAARKEERYAQVGRGRWEVTFRKKAREPRPPLEAVAEPDPPMAVELIGRGVTPVTARELARDFPAEKVARKLEVFDWLMARKDGRTSRNPAGYLAKSIRDDFADPKGFKARAQAEAERSLEEQAERGARARKESARREAARLEAEDERIRAHLAGLDAAGRAELEAEALAGAPRPILPGMARLLVRDHVGKLLGFPGR